MKVIVIHHPDGDSIAVVADESNLKGIFEFTEIDDSDSKDIIKSNPALQKNLQDIFGGVMAMFGLRAVAPEAPKVDA